MAKRFITFRERLKEIIEKRSTIVHLLDAMDLQFQHFDENEFAVPTRLIEAYNKAADYVDQFDKIWNGKPRKFSEMRQKKAMVLGFDEIFGDLEKEVRESIYLASKSWNKQKKESDQEAEEMVAKEFDDFIKNVDVDD